MQPDPTNNPSLAGYEVDNGVLFNQPIAAEKPGNFPARVVTSPGAGTTTVHALHVTIFLMHKARNVFYKRVSRTSE
jgi:hypothetical protein